jgi:DNA-binding response OmpR family regulator
MPRILIVEDERHLAEGLRFNLEAESHIAEVVETGEAALARLGEEPPFDAVVLDVMLPGIDGFAVATELRKQGQFVPVLMLTARGAPQDVLRGFAAGADDYLAKPFDLDILIARVHGLLRRATWTRLAASQQGNGNQAASDVYTFADKSIDFDRLEVHHGTDVLQLTAMEAKLLKYLIQHEGRIVSRKAILEDVWAVHEDTDTRAIDNFIVRLRRYLEDDPSTPKHLLTVRGIGYRFVSAP